MAPTDPSSARTWRYRFCQPGGLEIETGDFDGNEAAEAYARKLPRAKESPIIVERHNRVDWEYVAEIDQRP